MNSDTRTVEMRFDNKDFESNAKQTISTLDKLKSALKLDGASKGLTDVQKAADALDLDFKKIDSSIDAVGKHFSILETIGTGALLRIGMQAVDVGAKLLKSLTIDQVSSGWTKLADKTTAVQAIMSNIKDDTSKFDDEFSKMEYVNSQIEKLNWFSDETSYSLTNMTDAVGKFVSKGVGLEDSVTAVEGIALWAASAGQNSQTASRAFIQLSQALGSGKMQIRDWMSIESANMDTAEFKELAITIAQNKGLIKEGEVTIDNFRDTLNKGWMNKEVQLEAYKEYGSAIEEVSKKIEEYAEANNGAEISASKAIQLIEAENKELANSLGFKAFKRGQEAKTFAEVMIATSDAVSSKWMSVFEQITGNYIEQRELWTDLSNDLWEVFAAPIDRINNIFSVWKKGFDGISGRSDFLGGLKNIFDILIHGYKDEEGIQHSSIFGAIKSGISDVLGLSDDVETLGKRLWNLTHRFKEWTDSLKPSEGTLTKIKNAVKGLATALKLIGKTIGAIIKPFTNLFGDLIGKAASNLLDMSSSFGDWISNLEKLLDETNFFDNISNNIQNGIDTVRNSLNLLSESLTGMSIGELFGFVKEGILNSLVSFFGILKNLFSGVNTSEMNTGLGGLKSFFNNLSSLFSRIKSSLSDADGPVFRIISAIGRVFGRLSSVLSEAINKDGAFGLAKIAVKGGLAALLYELFSSLMSVFKGAKAVGGMLDDVGDVFSGLTKLLKANNFETITEGIKNLALSVALLALSVELLGTMDKSDLAQGLVALLALTGIIALLKTIVGGITGLGGVGAAAAFIAFGVAIRLLTSSVNALGNMDTAKLGQGIAAIALLTLIFGMFKGLVGTVSGLNLIAAAAAFTLFGVAVDILAIGVYALGSMDTGALVKGELAIAGLVLIFGLFRKLTASLGGVDLVAATASFAIFAIAVDILAIGVRILGSMDGNDIVAGEIAIAGLVLIFGLFRKVAATIGGIDLIAATASFAIFAVSVDILAIGVKVLGSMSNRDLTAGVVTIGLLVVIFGLFRKVAATIGGIDLIATSAAFAVFAVAIDLIVIGVKALGTMSGNELTGAVIAIGLIVTIFGLFRKLTATALGLDLVGATVAFALFAAAIDIMAIGVVALGQLDVGQITSGITAVAAMVLLYGVLSSLSAGGLGMASSATGFLAFSVALIAVAAAMNLLIPVMETVDGMGEGWWKPLVLLGGALALVVGAGTISGLPLVSAGLIVLSTALLLVGAAVGLASAGLALLTFAIADLVEAIAKYGPEAAANMGAVMNAILDSVISTAPKLSMAAIVLISAFAMGLIGSADVLALAAFTLLASLLNAFAVGIPSLTSSLVALLVSALNTIAAVIRASSSLILPAVANILSAIIELVIEVFAGLIGLIPGIGDSLSGEIRGWKGKVNDALTSVFEDAEQIGSDGASKVIDGFSGNGGGHSFGSVGEEKGKELIEGVNTQIDKSVPSTAQSTSNWMDAILSEITKGSTDGVDAFNLDFLSNISSSFGDFDIGSLTSDKMSEMLNSITLGGDESSIAFDDLLNSFGTSLEGFDLGGLMSGKMAEGNQAISDNVEPAKTATKEVTSAIESEFTSVDSYSWGYDAGSQYGEGISAAVPIVEAAARAMAAAVSAFLHFSEPDVGPLSDFHTYAPDMIKLWCSGIYSNLDKVESSSNAMADSVYDGFSTALEYVSDLIDNGMSDELAIRPVMDLSGIQNGIHNMGSLISGANGYTISGTARLASTTAYGMSTRMPTAAEQAPAVAGAGVNNYNTFNITNDDPQAVAQKVSRILDQGTRREQAVWAR